LIGLRFEKSVGSLKRFRRTQAQILDQRGVVLRATAATPSV
jgi:hypothetical protein